MVKQNHLHSYDTLGYCYPIKAFSLTDTNSLLKTSIDLHKKNNQLVFKNPHFKNDIFLQIIVGSDLKQYVSWFIGDVLFIENIFLIIKKPNDDFSVPDHQDGINPNLELDSKNSLTTWISISESNHHNGGLIIYPKSHLNGFYSYKNNDDFKSKVGTTYSVSNTPDFEEYFVTLNSGDSIFMNTKLLHKSEKNNSNDFRCALNIRWVNKSGVIKRSSNQPPLIKLNL